MSKRKKAPACVEHAWSEETLRDKNFGVAFGAVRICKVCGLKQVASHCEGRIGGPWRDVERRTGSKA